MKTKRITLPISANIDSIRKQLYEDHGVEYSYAQLVDYLINYYRKNSKVRSEWASAATRLAGVGR